MIAPHPTFAGCCLQRRQRPIWPVLAIFSSGLPVPQPPRARGVRTTAAVNSVQGGADAWTLTRAAEEGSKSACFLPFRERSLSAHLRRPRSQSATAALRRLRPSVVRKMAVLTGRFGERPLAASLLTFPFGLDTGGRGSRRSGGRLSTRRGRPGTVVRGLALCATLPRPTMACAGTRPEEKRSTGALRRASETRCG